MRVLIIEDENLTARRLEGQLRKYDPAIEVLERLPSVAAAVQWLRQHPAPDLIFLDIHLEDDLGFRIFEQVQVSSPIVFTTAYDEYMIQAFKVNSIDYLLKPINYDELVAALTKYQRLRQHFTPADLPALLRLVSPAPAPGYKERFLVSVGPRLRSVDTSEVAYFCFEDGATFLVTRPGQRLVVDYSLDKLGQVLNPQQFFRVNRQYLVGISAIDTIHHHSAGRLELILQPAARQPVLVSVDRATEFKDWLGR
ncbi:LytTR family DNA-binding domain-containing protein [Hymenobacter sp. 15J16-1T3B]|uniref:LytR/AlgR family response regulator transcription factor n=1 Tax=Hymenobacter sp. 15J16-1T3B TaxID=2886941 RepID=UPI001D103B90|nr:LytTR family DNA-binding domain-containing protein [Hymenobacter sp. 15J16-1T3B]MCC3156499.1 LytTR family DNA-binding domain-containing protein [Hymenobacter sp. 15J16-1T3B]